MVRASTHELGCPVKKLIYAQGFDSKEEAMSAEPFSGNEESAKEDLLSENQEKFTQSFWKSREEFFDSCCCQKIEKMLQ